MTVKVISQMIERVGELENRDAFPRSKSKSAFIPGKVLAGNIGNQLRKQYSLAGRTVIISSRIEQLNKTYGSSFLVSGDVYKVIGESGYKADRIGEVPLKGIEKPTEIFKLM